MPLALKMACTGITGRIRGRSVSAPALRVSCSSYSRERSRVTDLAYERGKDNLAHWISAWSFDEVCAVLRSLVARCPLNQLEYLWTVSLHFNANPCCSITDCPSLIPRPHSHPRNKTMTATASSSLNYISRAWMKVKA